MAIGEELFIGIVSGTVSGVTVGILLLWFGKIKWNVVFFKRRFLKILQIYEKVKEDKNYEEKATRKIGFLLDDNFNKFIRSGFRIKHYGGSHRFQNINEPRDLGDTISDNNFGIHLTRYYPNPLVYQFLIRRLYDGKTKKPDEVYFSMRYPSAQRESNDISVIKDFIEYFKKKN